MLVEKAYAKLHGLSLSLSLDLSLSRPLGSYASIDGGRIAEALADLTGSEHSQTRA